MEIAEFVLQNEGAVVTKAWNGQEAVERFKKSEPGEFDAILMDIMMPVMNGYEAAKTIRSMDRKDAKAIPIIAMTANAFTEDRIRAKEADVYKRQLVRFLAFCKERNLFWGRLGTVLDSHLI